MFKKEKKNLPGQDLYEKWQYRGAGEIVAFKGIFPQSSGIFRRFLPR